MRKFPQKSPADFLVDLCYGHGHIDGGMIARTSGPRPFVLCLLEILPDTVLNADAGLFDCEDHRVLGLYDLLHGREGLFALI